MIFLFKKSSLYLAVSEQCTVTESNVRSPKADVVKSSSPEQHVIRIHESQQMNHSGGTAAKGGHASANDNLWTFLIIMGT